MYKSQTHDIILGDVVGLIHADELMGTEELENLPLYAYEFTEQKEALSFLVSDNKLTQDNIMDVIISVGYRVKSKRGIEFRQWASKVLKQYMVDGSLSPLSSGITARIR